MTIKQSKKLNQLPKEGTKVKTSPKKSVLTDSFFVHPKHIRARKKGTGIFTGWVSGTGGDVWWIQHEDDTIGAYRFDEVFDL